MKRKDSENFLEKSSKPSTTFAICVSRKPYLFGSGLSADGEFPNLTLGKEYPAKMEGEWLRVWDDHGEDYLYPARMFSFIGA